MNKYELMVILSNSLTDEEKDALLTKINGFIESANGKVESTDKWGTKKFAYPINYKNEGFYVLLNLSIDPLKVIEIEKQMNLIENITRFMFVKK